MREKLLNEIINFYLSSSRFNGLPIYDIDEYGARNEYYLVEQDNFLLADGLYEAIIPEDIWNADQAKSMNTSSVEIML